MKILSNLNSLDNIQDGSTRKLITKTSTQGNGEILTDLTISGDTLILNKSDISSLTSGLLSTIYPIGSVIIREDSGDYSNWLGFNWDRAARGRFILGYDEKDSDTINNRTESVGGEKTHKLTVNEMPSHSHNMVDTVFGSNTNRIGVRAMAEVEVIEFHHICSKMAILNIGPTGQVIQKPIIICLLM